MNLDERLEYIATLQQTHDEQIGRLAERTEQLARQMPVSHTRMEVLTERTIQAMGAIDRLARIPDSHEDRTDALEHPPK